MNKKIVISGASGVGKTTMAKYIEERFRVPFITTSTKPLWGKHGIVSHIDLMEKTIQDPKWGIAFQFEVLAYREKMDKENSSYVTDRGAADNIVYFLLQCSQMADKEFTSNYIKRAIDLYQKQTHQIFIPFTNETVLEDDKMRVVNPFFQFTVDAIFERVLRSYIQPTTKIGILILTMWDLTKRKYEVDKYISSLELMPDKIKPINGKS